MSINPNSLVLAGQLQTAMTAVKNELDKVEANGELNVIEGISIDGASQSIANKTVTLNLSAYAKKTDVASGVHIKGTVASFDSLPLNAEIGDMYNVSVAGGTDANGVAIKAGDNVVKTESGWDNFGGLIDLSGKTDKVTSAVSGNVVTFGASGAVVDSGYAIAGDSDISAMITGIFGSSATPKTVPTLSVSDEHDGFCGTITYTGDGTLIAYGNRGQCTISSDTIYGPNGSSNFIGVICASETANYASTWAQFTLTAT